jgi:carbon monoxide dehydrogenase subunit G
MSKSPDPGTYLVFFNSQYSISPANSSNVINTGQAIEDLTTIYNEINNLEVTKYVAAAEDLGGKIVTSGVYSWGGALAINSDVTLDAENDPNAYFVFKTGGAFNTAAGVKIKLINGASASNIYWVATGAIGIGAACIVKGSLISKLAVAVGADCIVEGRMLTTAGAIAFGPGTVTAPTGTSFINFRTVTSFVMLTASGAIANTGVSTYNGDIATGLGAITAFETATVNGTVFPTGGDTTVIKEIDGNATFSLYQNGVLIPNSSRIRTTKLNTVDITLQGIATIAEGETIDVRWNIDAGTLSAKNRILTIIKVQ